MPVLTMPAIPVITPTLHRLVNTKSAELPSVRGTAFFFGPGISVAACQGRPKGLSGPVARVPRPASNRAQEGLF